MSEELTLLPCPACGHPVGIARTNGISAAFVICRHIGCALSGPIRKTDEAAVAAWNALPRALTWTNEPPKVPGWYWYKTSSHLGITKFPELCDRTREGWQWAGPIPEPRETKE